MKNTVTEKRIKELLSQSEVKIKTEYDKITIVSVKLPNGFVLTESSGAVDPANYNERIGTEICMQRIESKLWELEGYVLATNLASMGKTATIRKCMNFGKAIEALKSGKKVARRGWNGKGIYIELQVPDKHSKMTQPYIYIVTTGLQTDNPAAPKGVVPWLASQTDMLAEDWEIV